MPSLQDDGGRLNEANKEQCCEAQLNAEKGKPQVQKTVFQDRRYTQATVAPAINEQGRTRKHATQPEHPHRGPRWINEDHLPSIPSKLVRLSDHVVLAALQHPSQQEAGIIELYNVCIINFELLLLSNIRQQIITLLFELLFLST